MLNTSPSHQPVQITLKDLAPCQLGYQIKILDEAATISDYLEALRLFAEQTLADCKGCDGCCFERAPLTILDVDRLAKLCPDSNYPAHQVVKYFGELHTFSDGALDITLRRPHGQACLLLDQKNKCCSQHQARPFVCRSHFCLPPDATVHELRSLITNFGLDALIVQLYEEEKAGAAKILPDLQIEDYQNSPLIGKTQAEQVLIKAISPASFWETVFDK
ncbi:MAG: YkgJ family cysteine cluster protein [Bacillota bacterium]|jgi:Fe-S-cluster containining protein